MLSANPVEGLRPVDRSSTVLISGAFGQVGKRCVKLLLERGYRVVALDIMSDKTEAVAAGLLAEAARPEALAPVYVDLLQNEGLQRLVAESRPRVIIHLAAICPPAAYRMPELARKVNVQGTRNLVDAAGTLSEAPFFIFSSSAGVYGSRNPHSFAGLITAETPASPIDCYGEDKVLAEKIVSASGLPYCVLRLGAVISPDYLSSINDDYLRVLRSIPGDNPVHSVDARDVALACANAVERRGELSGKVLLIGGGDDHRSTQREMEDDIMETLGIGRLGEAASLNGDPHDDRGWSFTGWLDTSESQRILDFQKHEWSQTRNWIADAVDPKLRAAVRLLAPALRVSMRGLFRLQRKIERRGRYANPWKLITQKYGDKVMASTALCPEQTDGR